MIISPKKGFYFSQILSGGDRRGVGDPGEPSSYSARSSADFLFDTRRPSARPCPPWKKARIIRQLGAGPTICLPIIGRFWGRWTATRAISRVRFQRTRLYALPVVAKLLAELITTGNRRCRSTRSSLAARRGAAEKGPLHSSVERRVSHGSLQPRRSPRGRSAFAHPLRRAVRLAERAVRASRPIRALPRGGRPRDTASSDHTTSSTGASILQGPS